MMRKLIHVAYGVIKSNKPFDPSLPPLDTNNSIYDPGKGEGRSR